MILAVCLDDRGGMMFNRRRQSRDRVLIERLLRAANGGTIWIHPYSAPLFDGAENVRADEDFLNKAGAGELCFAETALPGAGAAERIIVYRWNRRYPADKYFDLDLTARRLVSGEDFAGHSHERITEEIYE